MANEVQSNEHSPSTAWEWRRVRVTRGAAGSKAAARKGHRWRRFPRLDRSKPLQLRVVYRGGAQAWIVVTARGETNVYPGDVALLDLMSDVGQWQGGRAR